MIVRDIKSFKNTEREVKGEGWTSTRLLIESDGMGFSFHETIIPANTELSMHYKNHYESVYCIEGSGKIINLEDKKEYEIKPGVIYALNKNDRHVLMSYDKLRLVCVFNPPVKGNEKHDKDGSYPVAS